MTRRKRITLTLPPQVVLDVRAESRGNISEFVEGVLSNHFDSLRRERLRQSLVAGYLAEAEADLSLSEEFRYADDEVEERYVPITSSPE